jgi:hypothetical protein
MGGLNARSTNEGVKNTLIHCRDHPAYIAKIHISVTSFAQERRIPTEISMTDMSRLVRWLPRVNSEMMRPTKRRTKQKTDAGNETWAFRSNESTPKQAAKLTRMPIGTRIHDRNSLCAEDVIACKLSLRFSPNYTHYHPGKPSLMPLTHTNTHLLNKGSWSTYNLGGSESITRHRGRLCAAKSGHLN